MTQSEAVVINELASEVETRLNSLPTTATESVRAIRREFSKRLKDIPAQTVVKLSLKLLEKPGFIHRFVAYELICHHRSSLRSLREKELMLLGDGIDSWEAVDTFACYLAGPAWRENQVSDGLIRRWADSQDRWWRRAALVSTVALNSKARGGSGDVTRTLEVCRGLTNDRDDMVVKAMSWALRELAKREPFAVGAFLEEHETVLAARIVREVRNKLTSGLKNPRRTSSQSSPKRLT